MWIAVCGTWHPAAAISWRPCNHLQADVPAENVVALYRYARENGTLQMKYKDRHEGSRRSEWLSF